jgi:hypothetical protein
MAIMTLSTDTIKEFDEGRIAIALRQALENAGRDCVDRPMEKRARSVVLRIDVVPIPENVQDGVVIAQEADVQMKVDTKIPTKRTVSRRMKLSRNGQFVFSSLTPENPDQTHIDELAPDGSGKVVRDRKAASAGD